VTLFLVLGGVGLLVVAIGVLGGELLDAIDVGPDWLSPLTVGAALSAFGFGGAIAASLTDGNATAGLVYGGATAVAVAGLAIWLTRLLDRDEADPATTSAALLGSCATVVDDVPADGYGTVRTTVAGAMTRLNARAGTALPRGTDVRIVDVLSPTSVLVEPLAPPDPVTDA
jgi:membrane protein implicated in regulation of membrane protease activity